MNYSFKNRSCRQEGAALVTVILVSLLLGTACVALLTAVSAGTRNNTDALSEYKAYYAAESGLQATIDVLRNRVEADGSSLEYSDAVEDSDLSYWLGTGKISVGSEGSYTITVSDPDNSAGLIRYQTQGTFEQPDGSTYLATRVYGSGADTLTFSFNGQAATDTAPGTISSFGSFQIVKTGNGATLSQPLDFRIDYIVIEPRGATRTIRGSIATNGTITFLKDSADPRPLYRLMGSVIRLCNSSSLCTSGPSLTLPSATTTPQTVSLYSDMTAVQPYRLKVEATGYGPNNSRKKLEAIIQRNYLNDLNSTGAISMIGPNAFFRVGTSSRMEIDGGAYPSITVSDQAGLDTVTGSHTNGTMLPPPEIQGNDIPDWQQSPADLDAFVQRLRQRAQNNGRYFNGTAPTNFGSFTDGDGLTFCEGSCSMSGNMSGGGILVVTGTFTTSGNPRFNGLVLAIGRYVSPENPGGVVRSGGGNELFQGNIVIAPYDPNNLAAGWEQPRYDQSGGPGDTVNSDVDVEEAFNGTSALTDFILGIAEK
jgi:hypothetical protein